MALVKITKLGLGSIAFLVAVLWSCWLMERSFMHHARMDNYRAWREIQNLKLQRTVEPASYPVPTPKPSVASRPVVG